jgi:hypothetical protein
MKRGGAPPTRLRNRSPKKILGWMSVTVNLSADELAKIKHFTELEREDEAVAKAAREFLRVMQLRELNAASGHVDYKDVGETMEALELREGKVTR